MNTQIPLELNKPKTIIESPGEGRAIKLNEGGTYEIIESLQDTNPKE